MLIQSERRWDQSLGISCYIAIRQNELTGVKKLHGKGRHQNGVTIVRGKKGSLGKRRFRTR